jgi:hypothetical protein
MENNMQELINKKFGKWTVISYEGKFNRVHKFKVLCDCGNNSISDYIALTREKSTQCRSCARKKWHSENENPAQTHGYSSPNHPEFHLHSTWCTIKQRCNNPKTKNYHRYGGRGIKMCPTWENNFEQFLKDMGSRPLGYSIDRKDNEKGYFKENCKWVTKEENSNNTHKTVLYEYEGKRLSETQWARHLNISRNKVMWWARKNGIKWVIENIESLRMTSPGMGDEEYISLKIKLPKKRDRLFNQSL